MVGSPSRRFDRQLVAVCILVWAMLAVAGCGSDAKRPTAAQTDLTPSAPTTKAKAAFDGTLDSVPRPDGATPVGKPTVETGITSRSYSAPTDPRQVADFYERTLAQDGWTTVDPVTSTGAVSYRGTWSMPPWTLRVSTTAAPGLDGASQFSLQIWRGQEASSSS